MKMWSRNSFVNLINGIVLLFLLIAESAQAYPVNYLLILHRVDYWQNDNTSSVTLNHSWIENLGWGDSSEIYAKIDILQPGAISPITTGPGYVSNLFTIDQHFWGPQAKSDMDAIFPVGVYAYQLTDQNGLFPLSLDYYADYYPSGLPYLIGSGYSQLQNLNIHNAPQIWFSDFVPNGPAKDCTATFKIFGPTGQVFGASLSSQYNTNCQSASNLNLTIPTNTLLPDTAYTYQIAYTQQIELPATGTDPAWNPWNVAINQWVTGGSFHTASTVVPEPSTTSLLLIAFAGLVTARQFKRFNSTNEPRLNIYDV